MAEYHLHGQIISRTDGKSAVAAAAYRAGQALHDTRLDQTFDYTRKHEVNESVILAPENAPDWLRDREALWNTVEAAERRRNSQVAREIDVGLMRELVQKSPSAAKQVLKEWVQDSFVAEGLIADISFHKMKGRNPHAHIMLTMRRIHPLAMEFAEGSRFVFEETKARDLNDWGYMDHWRETWADYANAAMAEHGIDARIDHRSLIDQGIYDREPGIHVGPRANAMQERGVETDRWEQNAWIWFRNEEPWFEENRRYVEFLDAEEAEERRLKQERAEAERAEFEAAMATLRQAGRVLELGLRLDNGIDCRLNGARSAAAELTARNFVQGQSHLEAASARLEKVANALAPVGPELLDRARSGEVRLHDLAGRMDVVAERLLLERAAQVATLGAGLKAIGKVAQDKALLLAVLTDRHDAQGVALLAGMTSRLGALRPDLSQFRVGLADAGHRLERAVQGLTVRQRERLAEAALALDAHRLGKLTRAVLTIQKVGVAIQATWTVAKPIRSFVEDLLVGIGGRAIDLASSLRRISKAEEVSARRIGAGPERDRLTRRTAKQQMSTDERSTGPDAMADYLATQLRNHLQAIKGWPMRRVRHGWVLEPACLKTPYYAELAVKVGDHEHIRKELGEWGDVAERQFMTALAGPERVVRMSDEGLTIIPGRLPEYLEQVAEGMLAYDPNVQAAAELAIQRWNDCGSLVESPIVHETALGQRGEDNKKSAEQDGGAHEQGQTPLTWLDHMIADPRRRPSGHLDRD